MLDIKFIRQNPEKIKESVKKRKVNLDVDRILAVDERYLHVLRELEDARAEQNAKSKSHGAPDPSQIEELKQLKEKIKILEEDFNGVEKELRDLLLQVPNLIHPDSPVGGEEDFNVLETSGKPTKFDFEPKDHEELLISLDLLDFERGANVTGAKFYFSKNDLVRLEQALINYGIDIVSKHGFTLMQTPDLAKNEILSGIGFNPRGEAQDQIYMINDTDLSLIATAEITMGGYHSNEVLDLSKGPKKYVALSHCFRKEAGAYGRESKGLYRVHQFTKLEMFIYCKPEDSEKMHKEILSIEKEIVEGLELPYRVIDIATGDLGAPAYRKFDIEAWMVMKNNYGEITSTSNTTDFQARRLNIRYKTPEGKHEFVHTLNGTAVVSSRFPIAIAENFQTKNGTIKVPKVLQEYMGIKEIK